MWSETAVPMPFPAQFAGILPRLRKVQRITAKIGELRQGQQGCLDAAQELAAATVPGETMASITTDGTMRRRFPGLYLSFALPLLIFTALAPTAAFAQPNCRNTGQLRPVAGRIQTRGRRPEDLRLGDRRRLAVPEIRSAHHQYRPRAAILRAELPRLLQEADPGLSPPARRATDQEARGHLPAHRQGFRRAGPGDRRVLGAGERFRRQRRQGAGAACAGDARL